MAPRRRCSVCGSKQWHKEPSSGLITCSEGHVLQNYRNESREVTELGPHALRKRALKSGRKRKEKQSKADPKLYHGERARYHYFQCLQLILQIQVAELIRTWNLPPEFEVVCRDIWALHLSLIPVPPPAEPLYYSKDQMSANSTVEAEPAAAVPTPAESDDDEAEEQDAGDHLDQGHSASSPSDSDEDPELAELLRENSDTSSSSDEESDSGDKPLAATLPKKSRPRREYDSPAGNLSVLVVACWTLRLPVTYMEFIRLIETYELPYLDVIRLLPGSLTLHLTKHTTQALSPHFVPSTRYLHKLASHLAQRLYSSYRVFTPEINAAPILWRAVRNLCGTPTLYMLTKKLIAALSLPLTLHHTLSSKPSLVNSQDSNSYRYDNAPPEVTLCAAVVIVLKMVYGLDGKTRLPTERNDPACALPKLSEFLEAVRAAEDTVAPDKRPKFTTTKDLSTLSMSNSELDEYLQFCQKALLPRDDRTDRTVAEYFPIISNTPPDSTNMQDDPPLKGMSATLPSSVPDALLPGQAYPIYESLDSLGELPQDLEAVISRAAIWAGVDQDYVIGVVERFERRLVRWGKRERKKEDTTARKAR